MQNICAEILLPTQELRDDIAFFTRRLGMRMDEIFPADDPREAVFSGHVHEDQGEPCFVMSGRMMLGDEGQAASELQAGDAFVIPPGMKGRYARPSRDLELLEVTLPSTFTTRVEP